MTVDDIQPGQHFVLVGEGTKAQVYERTVNKWVFELGKTPGNSIKYWFSPKCSWDSFIDVHGGVQVQLIQVPD